MTVRPLAAAIALALTLAATAAVAADLMVTQTGGGPATEGQTRTLIVTASSVSLPLPPNLTKTVTITLSAGLSQISASGPGWTCPLSGQVVTCVRSSSLVAGGSMPPITVAATVGFTQTSWSSCAVVSHAVNAAVQPDQVAGNNTACVGGRVTRRPR